MTPSPSVSTALSRSATSLSDRFSPIWIVELLELGGVERAVAVDVERGKRQRDDVPLLGGVHGRRVARKQAGELALHGGRRRAHLGEPPGAELVKVDRAVVVAVDAVEGGLHLQREELAAEVVGGERELDERQLAVVVDVELVKRRLAGAASRRRRPSWPARAGCRRRSWRTSASATPAA
jgi:hypothetical protein